MIVEMKVLNQEVYKYGLPDYATKDSAGIDLRVLEDVSIRPYETVMLGTGLAFYIGANFNYVKIAGLLLPRSSLGLRGLVLANTVGVIDGDYQGEIKLAAKNSNNKEVLSLKAGERVAQLIFIPLINVDFKLVNGFKNETERGGGGFGSTGL